GMGALQYYPAYDHNFDRSVAVEITELVALAQNVMAEKLALDVHIGSTDNINSEAILDILRVGTSAGGARPKAIIAMNAEGHILSGQATAPSGYDYWLLKFDGVTDLELGVPRGYGRIEYAYYLMAKAAGITMMECRLLEENARAHFLTKRFDRQNNEKIHVHSLCGIAHYDFNMAGAYSYEQLFSIMRKLRLDKAEIAEQYRRMVFNVIACNQDDHTKNIAFFMDSKGNWHLTPAFDVMYSHNPHGKWTNQHQMSINGKCAHFTLDDLVIVGESAGIPRPIEIIQDVGNAVEKWSECSQVAGVTKNVSDEISQYHRLTMLNA
ncbi:MAG: HipA domain-containing protein, partial [Pseudomonadota bacterium]|nr:HipA domain-containing protein [Pseudomonadota bacterium]